MKLIFDKSMNGRTGFRIPELDVPKENIDKKYLRKELPNLPETYELEVIRHYDELEKLNHSVDKGFYPLGSCTMKYNPVLNEEIANWENFKFIHPYQEEETVQGNLQIMYELQNYLGELTGMDAVTLQPAAGAHGELTGMLIIKKYLETNGFKNKTKVIVPDSAHGTNPASAKMAGFEIVEVKSNINGTVDIEELKKIMTEDIAAIMLTNPNTLGIFEKDILEISKIAKSNNTLLYYDGANLNAIMGKVRPGDMGFDVVHLNLHKTLSTPHGMGGPGSGTVGVKEFLKDYLPKPIVEKSKEDKYFINYNIKHSIGRVRSFYGNFLVYLKAYIYILSMGSDGLKRASELAVLNANYMKKKMSEYMNMSHEGICKHEFVIDGSFLKEYGVKTLDIAKRLMDFDIHPPTVYFPLIVKEAMMIEPTETESKERLDIVIENFKTIVEEAKTNPDIIKKAPHNTKISRLNELKANKELNIKY
ncbi:aminomethyl-transferring glycine dehydrogenase subunit GcvPB [Oceanotoga sp. DSM 15011]|uniref:Probable glycine dehydrogenase (decarboxylating) subunit 2 n=1 Tax=Oceanotoga teriensis TaxID=515440 RepID=A0AA45HHL9_9BACT|nr:MULTISPECIES: aminomethyl-transferring glycine dehydrogenase subunit GcvPB [Oceanotoga]MDN5343580.1 glycine dehydrogenase subunit 2 [Oceanotoga sp.]MDO7977309.1 aminomethyl-transferring glycine dehydrogenase subunit GcvPB [Oceanotoga teriensis]PWJ86728.1 glycine dehydrogenase (decarboxylating) beta subunit [Oceanotoga teriensis]UYP00471.1 aminomethyl-transferring glycine dehydrogenase subunit GcvPB [Oceanotoga sp. DSM 15011]